MAVFTREFDIDSTNNLLKFEQNIEGDVSSVVWDAAIVLAAFLDCENGKKKDFLLKKKVIELGSGIGCVGLTAACLGAHVIATDLASVLPNLKKNIRLNEKAVERGGGTITAQELDWAQSNINLTPPDVLLLSDCVYYNMSVQALMKVVCQLTSHDTQIYLSQELRDSETQEEFWSQFQAQLEQHFDISPVSRREQHSRYYSPDIVILKMKKKAV